MRNLVGYRPHQTLTQSRSRARALGVVVLSIICGLVSPAFANELEGEIPAEDFLTCAVFYRVMSGAELHRARSTGEHQPALANVYKEKMFDLMAKAKSAAVELYGEEMGPSIFDDEWRDTYNGMMNQMNGSYKGVSRVRYQYSNRCRLRAGFDVTPVLPTD